MDESEGYAALLKRCSHCRRWKPVGCDFYRNRKWFCSWCKSCMKARAARESRARHHPCSGCGRSVEIRTNVCRRCRFPARTSWSDVEIAWLTGLFEGEGTWSGEGRGLSIQMTDRDVIERAAALLGGRVNGPYTPRSRPGRGPYKPSWKTYMGREETLNVLIPRMWPLLGERRRQQVLEKRPEFAWLREEAVEAI